MKQQLFSFFLVLIAGISIGFFIVDKKNTPVNVKAIELENTADSSYSDYTETYSSSAEDIERLHNRITALEKTIADIELKLEDINQHKPQQNSSTHKFSSISKPLTKALLIDAGIDEQLAADIIRKKDEQEFQKLDLKDRAVRESFINTPRYIKELRKLNAQARSVREELGDDTYDRYLYASGKPNRVSVASVMQGSPADQAGFETGDMILSYADKNIFKWNEINKATTQGLRGEAVIVNVLRDGELLNISVPRGPLGVKLMPATGEPLGNSFY